MTLYEFYVRKYDPIAGNWLAQDTYRGSYRTPLSLQRYLYNYANPVNYVDRYGFRPDCSIQSHPECNVPIPGPAPMPTPPIPQQIVECSFMSHPDCAVQVCPNSDWTESTMHKLYENAKDFEGGTLELKKKAEAGGPWDTKKHILGIYGDTVQICDIASDYGIPGNINFCYQAESANRWYSNEFVLYNAGNVDEAKKQIFKFETSWISNLRSYGYADNPWDRTACQVGIKLAQQYPNQCVAVEDFCSVYINTPQKIYTPKDAETTNEKHQRQSQNGGGAW